MSNREDARRQLAARRAQEALGPKPALLAANRRAEVALAEIAAAMKARRAEGGISWATVGSAEHLASELTQIADMLLGRGEYAK